MGSHSYWKRIGTALLLVLAGCADTTRRITPPAVHAAGDVPLVVQYETSHGNDHVSQSWWYLRSANRIEKRIPDLGMVWIWHRHKNRVTMQQAWLKERRVIDYTTSDLKSTRNLPEWETLRHMLDPSLLSRLQPRARRSVMGHPARWYAGKIADTRLKILWMEDLGLPAEILRTRRGHTSRVRMTAIYPESQAPIQPIRLDDFAHMDFADLGDNEADPIWGRFAHPH